MNCSMKNESATVLNDLIGELYNELHGIAARWLHRERTDHTLQPTALVHELYLKLSCQSRHQYADRVHFIAIASRVMRQVLVDHARARATRKRSGGNAPQQIASIEAADQNVDEQIELIELDTALHTLAREDEMLAQLVEMRYFGGMTAEETAEALGLSVHVVRHDLRFALAWLRRELKPRPSDSVRHD